MRDVSEAIMELVPYRCSEIGDEVLIINPKHIEISKKCRDIFNQLMELIPEEKKNLLIMFSDLNTEEIAIAEEIMYLQGLKDGLGMKEILGG